MWRNIRKEREKKWVSDPPLLGFYLQSAFSIYLDVHLYLYFYSIQHLLLLLFDLFFVFLALTAKRYIYIIFYTSLLSFSIYTHHTHSLFSSSSSFHLLSFAPVKNCSFLFNFTFYFLSFSVVSFFAFKKTCTRSQKTSCIFPYFLFYLAEKHLTSATAQPLCGKKFFVTIDAFIRSRQNLTLADWRTEGKRRKERKEFEDGCTAAPTTSDWLTLKMKQKCFMKKREKEWV